MRVRVQGLSATLTWADGQIVIEHTRAAQHWGAPAVTRVAAASVVGVGWQPPNLIRNGMLQIQVAGVDPQRMEPSDPYTIVFTPRSRPPFQDLRHQLMEIAAQHQRRADGT